MLLALPVLVTILAAPAEPTASTDATATPTAASEPASPATASDGGAAATESSDGASGTTSTSTSTATVEAGAPATDTPARDDEALDGAGPRAPKTIKIRPHRGLTIAGAVVTGIGLAGRLGIDIFLGTVAGLKGREAYGTWSVGPFFMATAFSNAPTLVGLGLLGGGAYREGHRSGGARGVAANPRKTKLGWGLLGGGLGLWALSRALFYPWVKVCQTNACAYGYLETTYYASAGLAIVGLRMLAIQAGLRRAKNERDAGYIHITPVLSPTLHGLALSGRF